MNTASDRNSGIDWRVYSARDLADHADAWEEINRRNSNLPILGASFYHQALRQFGTGEELLAIGSAAGKAVSAAILRRRKTGVWATFQPSQAPLGAWMIDTAFDSLKAWCGLMRSLPGPSLLLGISQQDPRLALRPDDSGRVRTLDYIDTASISLRGCYDEYWAQRGRNLRQNLKRQRNRLVREGIEPRLDRITDVAKIGTAVDEYGELESLGWKTAKGTAVHPTNAQGRFYKAVFEDLARNGEAVVYRYWYGDELAASDLCVQRAGVFIILKTAHNEDFAKTSPTHLMRQDYLRDLFVDADVERVEFYGKLMDWHTKWSDDVRRMFHVNVYRSSIVAVMRDIATSSAEKR